MFPVTEWIYVVSRASSGVSGGIIAGNRYDTLTSIVTVTASIAVTALANALTNITTIFST